MPKFAFRLSTLLSLREAARDDRRWHFAEALKAEQIVAERLDKVEEEILELRGAMVAAAENRPLNVDHLIHGHRYEAVLRAEQSLIRRHGQQIAAELEQRRQALVAADREVHVLEQLREKQHRRHREADARREQHVLDEIAGRTRAEEDATCWGA